MSRLSGHSVPCAAGLALSALLMAGVFVGCAPAERTTRMTAADLIESTELMAQSLRKSNWLAERDAASPTAVVVINRVQNLSSDVIPLSEQWMVVARVRNQLPLVELAQQKNVRFVITPERQRMLSDMGFDAEMGDTTLEATHVMTATFLSAARASRDLAKGLTDRRTDLYYLEYAITGVDSREVVWTDRFEFQRQAKGLLID